MTTLTTDRLTLRPVSAADWPLYERWHGDDASKAWDAFTGDIGHWVVKGFGWFIARKGDTAVGNVAVHYRPEHADLELAWNTYDGHRGAGYAPEAARAVRDWAIAHVHAPRLVSYITRTNTASQRVAQKLGAVPTGQAAAHSATCDVWDHLWRAS
ncbi:GNAT family N-acetyltransferase [Rhodobacteraceae bacterium N5(2021)]|uniref:GNAT family N-acetyltransferase n=1 Tax=Gymnodinialimonas phycosphaerae TaxID=2841589 RepID=A0A975TUF0_9RHOB|nr:GNAT family N-acetyltransferase [Gymnodinialimonas phycosphaerae]MBY4894817.1 GNAT family N-acetyltransferase [Gymnodinialimonas phycosphaerae]